MVYNNGGNSGCRIGNWVEEYSLQQYGNESGKNRFERSFMRAIEHSTKTHPREYRSASSAAHDVSVLDQGREKQQGPRRKLLEKQFLEQAKLDVEKPAEERPRFHSETSTKASFRAPDEQFRKDNRTRSIPRGGPSKPRPIMSTSELEEAKLEEPITFYTQNLVRGIVKASSTGSTNPFARNTGFSAPVPDGTKVHHDAEDGTQIGDRHQISTRRHIGASIVNVEMTEFVQSYLRDESSLQQVTQVVTKHLEDENQTATEKDISTILSDLNVPMNWREMECLKTLWAGNTAKAIIFQLFPVSLDAEAVEQKEDESKSSQDSEWRYVAVVHARHGSHQEEIEFTVPKSKCQFGLKWPQDIPLVKTLIRRQCGKWVNKVFELKQE